MIHHWNEKDDIKVLYIVKYGYHHLPYSKYDIAKMLNVSEGSLCYRIGNFKAIQGIGKAKNFAKLSKQVYDKYNNLSEKELCNIAFNH